MAIGDDAAAAGFPLVDEDDEVKLGYEEINRTRDMVAHVQGQIPGSEAAYRTAAGINSGTDAPTGGDDGDVYFQIMP